MRTFFISAELLENLDACPEYVARAREALIPYGGRMSFTDDGFRDLVMASLSETCPFAQAMLRKKDRLRDLTRWRARVYRQHLGALAPTPGVHLLLQYFTWVVNNFRLVLPRIYAKDIAVEDGYFQCTHSSLQALEADHADLGITTSTISGGSFHDGSFYAVCSAVSQSALSNMLVTSVSNRWSDTVVENCILESNTDIFRKCVARGCILRSPVHWASAPRGLHVDEATVLPDELQRGRCVGTSFGIDAAKRSAESKLYTVILR